MSKKSPVHSSIGGDDVSQEGGRKKTNSKITEGCLSNARSRRLVGKYATAEAGNSPKSRVKKTGNRPKPRPAGRRGMPSQQRVSANFEFDAVYDVCQGDDDDEHTVPTVSELTCDNSRQSSPPSSPVPQYPNGSPPAQNESGSRNGFYRTGSVKYNAQNLPHDQSQQRPDRVSHRRQPYKGYSHQQELGPKSSSDHHDMHPMPIPAPGPYPPQNGYMYPPQSVMSLPNGMLGGHFVPPGSYPVGQTHGQGQLSTSTGSVSPVSSSAISVGEQSAQTAPPVILQTPISAQYYALAPPGQGQGLMPGKAYMRSGNPLSLESRRTPRKGGDVGSNSVSPKQGTGSFQFEIDLETLKKLELHEQKQGTGGKTTECAVASVAGSETSYSNPTAKSPAADIATEAIVVADGTDENT